MLAFFMPGKEKVQHPIKNRKPVTQPEFWFQLISNRNDFSNIRIRSIRKRIGNMKIQFQLIRNLAQEILFWFRILKTTFRLSHSYEGLDRKTPVGPLPVWLSQKLKFVVCFIKPSLYSQWDLTLKILIHIQYCQAHFQ